VSDVSRDWVLDDPASRATLEGDVFDLHPAPVTVTDLTAPNPLLHTGQTYVTGALGMPLRRLREGRMRVYSSDIDVPGYHRPAAVAIAFFENPPYDTYGLPPEDYPRVWGDLGARSKHRMTGDDDALCLWHAFAPVERRWIYQLGLLELIEITRRHLFKERQWRASGTDEWIGHEAPHGLPAGYQRIA
jgi:hypothetical protein